MSAADTSRPAQRTYGRARQPPATGEQASSFVYSALDTSPSKMLNRFTNQSSNWLGDTRNALGQSSSTASLTDTDTEIEVDIPNESTRATVEINENEDEDEDDIEPTEEEIKAAMKLMKAAARPQPPAVSTKPRTLASQPLFGSSSLTELPSSTPPTKPAITRPRKPTTLRDSVSPQPGSPLAPTSPPARTDPPPRSASPPSTEESVERLSSTPVAPSVRRKYRPIESDDDDEESSPEVRTGGGRGVGADSHRKPGPVELSDAAEDEVASDAASTPKAKAPIISFSDDETQANAPAAADDLLDDEEIAVPKRGKLPKALSKVDQETMERDIARAQRDRAVVSSRPVSKRRPVTEWMAKAHDVVNASSQSSSRSPPLTSDIEQFTPSSGPNRRRHGSAGPLSSPTPGPSDKHHVKFASPHVAVGEAGDQPVDDKQRALSTFKASILSRMAKEKEKADAPVDDDLSVIPDEPIIGRLSFAPTSKASDRATLARIAGVVPNRSHQSMMRWSNKRVSKQEITETHVEFAGRQFGHANLKRANAGSRPAGQKAGRDEVITQQQVDNQMRARHLDQVRAIARDKAQKYGFRRELPEKRAVDIPSLISSEQQDDDLVAESDEDDSDFALSGEEDGHSEDDENHPSAVEGTLPDELEIENDTSGIEENTNEDKENVPVARESGPEADDDDSPFLVSTARNVRKSRKARRVLGSDDEEEPVKQAVSISVPEIPKTSEDESLGFDLAGFGSAGGGFSQLFGGTPAQEDGVDAFAALRDAPDMGFLPTHAMLPGVDISETQKRRDNALIAGEVENENQAQVPQSVNKKQYLNSQGFFTQTRPAGRELTQTSSVDILAVPEDDDSNVLKSSSTLLNSGHDDPSPPHEDDDEEEDEVPAFSRLRRRKTPTSKSPSREPSPSPAKVVRNKTPVPRNAFDVLQRGAVRDANQPRPKPAFLDEQAEESDEDNGWGMNTGKDDDDDDADLDNGYVPELLDDKQMNDEEKQREAELAAAKFREVEEADDAKREAEAKKVTEGHFRQKRHGNEFLSDEEDEEGKPRRWTKKQRRLRKLEGEHGLHLLGDEKNTFPQVYEADLESDNELEEQPLSPDMSPVKAISATAATEMLRRRAEMNRINPQAQLFAEDAEESFAHYAIRKGGKKRPAVAAEDADEMTWSNSAPIRSVDKYSKYLSEEASNPRRGGGGVSVVSGARPRASVMGKERGREVSSSRQLGKASSSILLDRNDRFAK